MFAYAQTDNIRKQIRVSAKIIFFITFFLSRISVNKFLTKIIILYFYENTNKNKKGEE